MKLKKWELALILALGITFLCGATLSREQEALSDKLIRLHVVANSDSEADQALKLKVRDRILEDVGSLLGGVTERDKAVKLIDENLDAIIRDAKEVIISEGYAYDVSASITVEEFPTREYDTFSLPAGNMNPFASSSVQVRGTTGGASYSPRCAPLPQQISRKS